MTSRRLWLFVVAMATVTALAPACNSKRSSSRITGTSGPPTTRAQVIPPQALLGSSAGSSVFDFQGKLSGALSGIQSTVSGDQLASLQVGSVAVDFLNLIERVKAASYSVGYQAKGQVLAQMPGDVALTIVHTPDTTRNAFSGSGMAAESIVSGGSAVACQEVGGTWACTKAPPGTQAVTADSLLYIAGLFVQNPGAYDMQQYTTKIVDVPVRCIKGTPVMPGQTTDAVELCVTAEGVPLRVAIPQLTLEGVWYRPAVAADAFTPPAPVR